MIERLRRHHWRCHVWAVGWMIVVLGYGTWVTFFADAVSWPHTLVAFAVAAACYFTEPDDGLI